MKSYTVYLTRSSEVAALIARAYRNQMGVETEDKRIVRIANGCAYGCDKLPEIYRDEKLYYCLVEMEADHPHYEIVFA